MHVSRLRLHNIRCFERIDLSLGKQWTVIVGANGTGKTTLLRAMGSAWDRGDVVAPDLGWMRNDARAAEVRVLVGRRRFDGAVFDSEAVHRVSRESTDHQALIEHGAVELVVGLGAVRVAERSGFPGPPGERVEEGATRAHLHSLAGLYGWYSYRINRLYDWIRWEDFIRLKAEKRESHRPSVIGALAAALNELFDGAATFREVSTRGGVLFDTPDGPVELESLADGLRSIFVIVAELVLRLDAAFEQSANPLHEEAFCLIDELDAHLHPRMQRTVLPALRKCFPNVQFVVTTHSPYVVGSAEPGEIVALRRVPGGAVEAFTDLPDVRGWTADQIATSEIFGLDTTRDYRGEKALRSERELLAKGALTPLEKRRLAGARELLDTADGPTTAMVRQLIATPASGGQRKTTSTKPKRRVARKRRSTQ